jgi:hypothetical protein
MDLTLEFDGSMVLKSNMIQIEKTHLSTLLLVGIVYFYRHHIHVRPFFGISVHHQDTELLLGALMVPMKRSFTLKALSLLFPFHELR